MADAVDLWLAILEDDPRVVRDAITNGAPIDARGSGRGIELARQFRRDSQLGRSPDGWRAMARHFLAGPVGESPWTALMMACALKSRRLVRALLDAGANPNESSDDGLTPLLIAAARGDRRIVCDLLKRGADPNRAQPSSGPLVHGHAPLMRAAGDGDMALVTLLLTHGADPDFRDATGASALLVACQGGIYPGGFYFWELDDILDFVADGSDDEPAAEDAVSPTKKTFSGLFANRTSRKADRETAHRKIARKLIDLGVDVEARRADAAKGLDAIFPTPLIAAIWRGEASLVRRLLERGATLRAVGGTTPVHAARRHPKILSEIVARGADIEARDGMGLTPLAAAVANDEVDLFEQLIGLGARWDATDSRGATLLHLAARSRPKMIDRLIALGIAVDAAISLAPASPRVAALELDNGNSENGDAETSRARIARRDGGWFADAVDDFTPLMAAALALSPVSVHKLLEHGADPARRASNGWNARGFALVAAEHGQHRNEALRKKLRADQESMQNELRESLAQIVEIDEKFGGDHAGPLRTQIEQMESMAHRMAETFTGRSDERTRATLELLPE